MADTEKGPGQGAPNSSAGTDSILQATIAELQELGVNIRNPGSGLWYATCPLNHQTAANGTWRLDEENCRSQEQHDAAEMIDAFRAEKTERDQAEQSAVDALLARMLDRDALDSIPPAKPLIMDVLDLESESWVIGPPGGFKSFVALDWACHVATGKPWRNKAVTQGKVVYVAAEGQKGIPVRVKAWEAMYHQRADGILFLPEPVQVTNATAWDTLVAACQRIKPILIVLDTQARITVGLDENSNGAMSTLTEAVRKLKAATGACVLVVHHTGRSGGDARGASAIDGAQDTEIRVERPEAKGKRANLTATISTDKQKDGDESIKFEVQLQVMELGTDPTTGRPLSSLALKPASVFAEVVREEPEWKANLTEHQAEILGVLHDHSDATGASRQQALTWIKEHRVRQDRAEMNKSSFDSAVKALVAKELVRRIGTGRIALAELVDK